MEPVHGVPNNGKWKSIAIYAWHFNVPVGTETLEKEEIYTLTNDVHRDIGNLTHVMNHTIDIIHLGQGV